MPIKKNEISLNKFLTKTKGLDWSWESSNHAGSRKEEGWKGGGINV